jgi:hypothetical protein
MGLEGVEAFPFLDHDERIGPGLRDINCAFLTVPVMINYHFGSWTTEEGKIHDQNETTNRCADGKLRLFFLCKEQANHPPR